MCIYIHTHKDIYYMCVYVFSSDPLFIFSPFAITKARDRNTSWVLPVQNTPTKQIFSNMLVE